MDIWLGINGWVIRVYEDALQHQALPTVAPMMEWVVDTGIAVKVMRRRKIAAENSDAIIATTR